MKINQLTTYILTLIAFLPLAGCGQQFREALQTEEVESIDLVVQLSSAPNASAPSQFSDLEIQLTNVNEKVSYQLPVSGATTTISDVLPGVYTINVSGESTDMNGNSLLFKGGAQNEPLLKAGTVLDIELFTSRLSPLIFKEIFYSGTPNFYFRNQFYELYNNSEEVVYLDGIYFCIAFPGKATTRMPIWPEEDNGKYVYTDRLWKFPGDGNDYPLRPGESCVISQFAANHQLTIYNPDSPINGFSSEFEFNMNNARYPDQPAYDMVHVFFDGLSEMGRSPQYLTTVFGAAYLIFKVPDGESYDPVGDPSLQTTNLATTSAKLYAKIPIKYVLDAVEAGDNENAINMKRLPIMLDAGMTWVGDTYTSTGVVRKKIGERPDGTPLLQDTNNSTDDFERGVVPELRRFGAKMPAWNHTLQN